MNMKLFIYNLKLPHENSSSILFSVLSESEETAQNLILNKVKNEIYKNELKQLFSNENYKPIVYESGDVFIQILGDIKLFTQ